MASYNSRGHALDRIRYIDRLLDECDIVLLQDWELHKLTEKDNISVLGISGMDPQRPIAGRPYGGCALLFNSRLKIAVANVATESRRLFACTVTLNSSVKIILCSVYMPCDSHTLHDSDEFSVVLSEIDSVIALHDDIDFVLLGGDFNVDISRVGSSHLRMLEEFCNSHSLIFCHSLHLSNVDYTYKNEFTGVQSTLDHFIVSKNLLNSIVLYSTRHDGDNISDHDPVFLELNFDVSFFSSGE